MDIGSAFLLGFLVGQWVTLFAMWRALPRLVKFVAQDDGEGTDKPDLQTMIIDLDDEREHRSRF